MHKIARLSIALAATMSSLGFPAAAQTANHDVHCLILSNFFSKAADNDIQKKAASEAGIFYLGRLDNKISGPQLEATIEAEGKSIKPATAGAEMGQCLKGLQAAGAAMQATMAQVRQKQGK